MVGSYSLGQVKHGEGRHGFSVGYSGRMEVIAGVWGGLETFLDSRCSPCGFVKNLYLVLMIGY